MTAKPPRQIAGFWRRLFALILNMLALASVLEGVVVLRIHLDLTNSEHGGLRMCPGSHRLSLLNQRQVQGALRDCGRICPAFAPGDALVMRPLLLHASGRATSDRPRPVIHLEYAHGDLGYGLEWAHAA